MSTPTTVCVTNVQASGRRRLRTPERSPRNFVGSGVEGDDGVGWSSTEVHCCLFGTLSCGRKQQALAQHATSKSNGPMHASSKSTQPESKPVAKGVEGVSFQGSKGGAH